MSSVSTTPAPGFCSSAYNSCANGVKWIGQKGKDGCHSFANLMQRVGRATKEFFINVGAKAAPFASSLKGRVSAGIDSTKTFVNTGNNKRWLLVTAAVAAITGILVGVAGKCCRKEDVSVEEEDSVKQPTQKEEAEAAVENKPVENAAKAEDAAKAEAPVEHAPTNENAAE